MRIAITYRGALKGINLWVVVITAMLFLLWIPVVVDKVSSIGAFKAKLLVQPFGDWIDQFFSGWLIPILAWALVILEMAVIVLLITPNLNHIGMWLSFVLMLIFTCYVAFGLYMGWDGIVCACGSIISGMSWWEHFWFNLFFLIVSGLGIKVVNIQRRNNTGGVVAEGGSAIRLDIKTKNI